MSESLDPNWKPPVCKHLRTKKFYIVGNIPEVWDPERNSPSSIWCLRTMTDRGPDDMPVTLGDCREGRGCYERWEE